jgi:N-acetylmuramoyl-L-alanine amidase
MRLRKNNPIGIMIHCSDSHYGGLDVIKFWHTIDNGWDDIGYNWVLTNGELGHSYAGSREYIEMNDGLIQIGRDIKYAGAHAKGYNDDYLSICLVGEQSFTSKQWFGLIEFLHNLKTTNLIDGLITGVKFDETNLKGHYEVNAGKTCPNIDMNKLRELMNER